MMLTIPKDKNFAYRPVDESPEQMTSSFFLDVYCIAEKHIEEILNLSNSNPSGKLPVEHSNIIAFTGGRGEGKTSAMNNVRNLLDCGKKMDGTSWESDFFVCLPIIDPSHISSDETIIDIVLSRMLICFEDYCNKNDVPTDQKRQIYQAFSETYKAVRVICQSREARHSISDSLEGLQSASAGNNLRNLMFCLVDQFLQKLGCKKKKRGCLVLCVDDIDMNIQQGYNICEELRKYLNIPNVIILFSLYISQMNDLVRQQYLKDFAIHLKHQEQFPLIESVSDMAKKYLEKLIPFDRRCALPKINLRSLKDIHIQYEDSHCDNSSLQDELLRLLYEKSGLILVKSKDEAHAFLPTTLRGVTHLITLLLKMESVPLIRKDHNYQLSKAERITLESNLNTVSRYIKEYNIIEFSKKSASILEALLETPQENLNLRVILMMYAEFPANSPDLIPLGDRPSVGDVLYVMHKYSNHIQYEDKKAGLFAALFKILYSIRILQSFLIDGPLDRNMDDRKIHLHQLLGSLIYNVDRVEANTICRGFKPYEELFIDSLKSIKDTSDFEDLLDELLIGTVGMGRPDLEKHRSITEYLNSTDRDNTDIKREVLAGKRGNTFHYFIYSYLGHFLTPLLPNSNLQIRNKQYHEWRNTYFSPLPILSMDCIDAYVSSLYRATINYRKSQFTPAVSIMKGSPTLVHDIIDRTCIDPDSANFFKNAFDLFPFMKEKSLVEQYIMSTDTSKHLQTAEEVVHQIISLSNYLEKLESMTIKYKGITESSRLLSTYETTDSGKLQATERERQKALNDQIRKIKSAFKDETPGDKDSFTAAKNQILKEIATEIQFAKGLQKQLVSHQEESE